jgi:hypothetical protein
MDKKYYFYIDEGGAFGPCNICIVHKALRYHYIKDYFFGRLSLSSIRHHIYLFKKVYPTCLIMFDPKSDIKYTKEDLSDYNLNPGM